MKELSKKDVELVSGGAWSAPATTANNVGTAMIAGALAGIPLGPWGMIGSAALAGIYTGIGAIH